MKVCIVCTFDTLLERVRLVKKYYKEKGHDVIVISSSFSHRKKKSVKQMDGVDYLIPTRVYKRNLSYARLRNHYEFAQSVEKELEQIQPDLIYCIVPCNALCKFMAHYKKEHSCQLIFDILDVWPETMPISKMKELFPFTIWKNLRNAYLKYADSVFCECEWFQDFIPVDARTLYFAREQKPLPFQRILKDDELNFCYLGSINNIIDIDCIVSFLQKCNAIKKVNLHIIGNGEKKEAFMSACHHASIQVIDHKEIYGQKQKQDIFDQCHFGLNVMKPSVVVGLTMKSIDYLCGSLPIINTIQADTKYLVEKEHIGYQMEMDDIVDVVCHLSLDEIYKLKENSVNVYNTYFTYEVFKDVLESAGV